MGHAASAPRGDEVVVGMVGRVIVDRHRLVLNYGPASLRLDRSHALGPTVLQRAFNWDSVVTNTERCVFTHCHRLVELELLEQTFHGFSPCRVQAKTHWH